MVNKKKVPLKSRLLKLLLGWLPNHIKRMIFITTFSKLILDKQPISDKGIETLNRIMHLSEREDAMRFSTLFTDSVWQGYSLRQICAIDTLNECASMDEVQIKEILDRVYKHTPVELHYARSEEMCKDLATLIRYNKFILA